MRIPKHPFKLLFDLVAMPMPHANHAIAHQIGLGYSWSQAIDCPLHASAPASSCALHPCCQALQTIMKQQISATLYFYRAKPWHAVLHGFLDFAQVVFETANSSTCTHSLSVTQHQHSYALQSESNASCCPTQLPAGSLHKLTHMCLHLCLYLTVT